MRLLVTRPVEDSEKLATKLRALGHDPVVAPIMEVQLLDGDPLTLDGVQATLSTSANGVRALARRTSRRDVPLFAVGPQTAETARTSGFINVVSADGDAAALAELIVQRLDPNHGSLFHAAGAETAGRLRQRLEASGFIVASEILYEARPIDGLPPTAADALAADALDGIFAFSPRSGKTLAALVTAAGLAPHCARLDAYCISAAAAEGLAPLAFARIAVAAQPNEAAILALLPGNRVA
jgi:uroporphyrinogen-III synthase